MFSRVFDELTWIAELSNNQHAFQTHDTKTWLNLKEYCDNHDLTINWIELQFRSHIERIEPADAYYIAQTMSGTLFTDNIFNGINVGRLVNGHLSVDTWRVPELVVVDNNIRDIAKYQHILIKATK